ncbi:MAG: hypothetical protein A3C12_03445 [Candidatus Sungbacteria bacterium RIFCSPHIGHO2_02_FULL_49_20]|uniref:DUF5667 domain-containing protein n=1 Tax=Candidatus Sungbacteria bacterium RIFCSPHIGHO2_02_FULL_49_20 TaxID=1802272 RepID=A0A1G2KPA4_9BACT|nr:MAG: hypothetical protein A3C12_03445 [Candidatus Sungbacteria bacterium RIFCSPHIGHO2_02_FULL_49_20]
MRFLSGVLASVIILFSSGFFPSVVEAKQNTCDPEGESYDARACFEYVQTLEAKNASVKRDLAAARRDTSALKSRLKDAEVRHTRASDDSRLDAVSRAWKIRALETTVKILSEEKEIAWGYVNTVSRTLALVIGLVLIGGIAVLAVRARPAFVRARHAIEMRDKKIRELEAKLRSEADAKHMAQGDVAALRLELFHSKSDLLRVRGSYNNFRRYVKQEMSRFETIRDTLFRTHATV